MDWRLTPLALAISTSLMFTTNVWAEGGASGDNGQILITPDKFSNGASGTTGTSANGSNGADFLSKNTLNITQSFGSGHDGQNGQDVSADQGGGGNGGAGGGSAFGAFSQGGAAGTSEAGSNGGNGGNIAGKTINISNGSTITLRGTAAGDGGHGDAGGSGGAGGGSIFGGLSQGGAGGYSNSSSKLNSDSTSTGGSGGAISGITMTLNHATLNGALGGNGSGGGGGAGGGAIFGGLSQGGAGGDSKSTTKTIFTSSSASSRGDGGSGGAISDITMTLSNVTLNGAPGGNADNQAGGGAGGGSIFGGLSQGGTGGSSYAYAVADADAGAKFNSTSSSASSAGGSGGAISDITMTLNNVMLTGAPGGNGGNQASGGRGGAGGGSIFGGLSQGGTGESSYAYADVEYDPDITSASATSTTSSAGGSGGAISDITMTLSNVMLTGAPGGNGDNQASGGGAGGGSIFGGLSQGGAGGHSTSISSLNSDSNSTGGSGGAISGITMTLSHVTLSGALGGNGAGGGGGTGGGSIFGSLSQGGAGGNSEPTTRTFSTTTSSSAAGGGGGSGGAISDITMTLSNVTLNGALGGHAGNRGNQAGGGGGSGGAGGGSIIGGLSQGGAGGRAYFDSSAPITFPSTSTTVSSTGGSGGAISDITMTLSKVTLTGAEGGNGGDNSGFGGNGSGGTGGGSIFGGLSQGGAGGLSISTTSDTAIAIANGGNGGSVSRNTLLLSDVELIGKPGGESGRSRGGGAGHAGINGGSIFGGYSAGSAGGYANVNNEISSASASGGAGGDSSNNIIKLSGASSLTGDIYGGYSQGGSAGEIRLNGAYRWGETGTGGHTENNHITLTGTNLSIAGAVYGGYSADGDGTLQNSRAFNGNTLNLNGYKGSVKGLYNFENYNWLLPKGVVNQDTLIKITGSDQVDLNNTQHTVAMVNDGNRLNEGDKVVLIDKAQGTSSTTQVEIEQGHFIIYDAKLGIENDAFVLNIDSKKDTTPLVPSSAGRLNPKSESFLQGRAAALAFTNQGTDMIRKGLSSCINDVFFISDGGSNRYDTGSNIRVRDYKMALGVSTCFELQNTSKIVFGGFIDHGQGNYDSHNSFAGYGDVRGSGDLRYTGAGLLFHMDVADTAIHKNTKPVAGSKEGLYLNAVVRAGKVKTDFSSHDLIDAQGVRGEYNTKSQYVSAMAGIGYAFNLDDKQSVDVYSHYSWSHISADNVMIGNDRLSFGADNSSRLRTGTRYTYAATQQVAPYAGIAYEHEFEGKATGKAYDMSIKSPNLSGSTGVVEVGVSTTPIASLSAIKLDVGVQGFFGERKGATGSVNLSYAF